MEVEYLLIVSQCYYSHHCFVVKPAKEDEHFSKVQNLIIDLEKYKREDGDTRDYYFGGAEKRYFNGPDMRINVNDSSGDIYIIPCQDFEETIYYCKDFWECSNRSGYKRKEILDYISNHHSYNSIKTIVKKHFEIL